MAAGRGPGRPVEADPEAIALTALRLFAARGIDEVTMADVAEAAGVSRRTLYRWFSSKGALVWGGAAEADQRFEAAWTASADRALFDRVRAGYEASVASYRRTVLTAMQEVEDGITGLAALERAHAQAGAAVQSAARVLDMANARYEGGASGYLEVITAQQGLLNNERLRAQLQGQRLLTAVFLVKALGGGWTSVQ